jgi:hypothetical protein
VRGAGEGTAQTPSFLSTCRSKPGRMGRCPLPGGLIMLIEKLSVRNFRGLSSLELPGLGDLNLLVGESGVGKTSVLEAIEFYLSDDFPSAVEKILRARQQQVFATEPKGANLIGRQPMHRQVVNSNGSENDYIGSFYVGGSPLPLLKILFFGDKIIAAIDERKWEFKISEHFFDRDIQRPKDFPEFTVPNFMIPVNSIGSEEVINWWENLLLTPYEDDVTDLMRLFDTRIERIGVSQRNVRVRIAGESFPVTLQSLGDGATRLFGIAVAAVAARGGVLLIDEFENGLHHTLQRKVWSFLFEATRRLGIQVFATTHSTDCIRAFADVAAADPAVGVLYRLEKKSDHIRAVRIDEEDLVIIADRDIEVR